MEKIVRWEAKGVGNGEIRYALRTKPKGKGEEIGAYRAWDNAIAQAAAEEIASAIEQEARDAGYVVDELSWNDID